MNVYSLLLISYAFPSSFPLFAEFSLLRCTRLCLDIFLPGKKPGRFFPYDQFTIHERRGYSQAVLTPNAAEFRRLCKAMGGEADFGASKLGQLAWCGCDPPKRYWTTWKQSRFFNWSLKQQLFWSFVSA